jgi:hypothetical protein
MPEWNRNGFVRKEAHTGVLKSAIEWEIKTRPVSKRVLFLDGE